MDAAGDLLAEQVGTALPGGSSSDEARIAAVLRVVGVRSTQARNLAAEVGARLGKQREFNRELYAACVHVLAETHDKRLVTCLKTALVSEEAGGLATLSAACFATDACLGAPLQRASQSQKTQVSFAAEIARLCRGESPGLRLTSIAPRIKEAHRIALCIEVLLPLAESNEIDRASLAPLCDALDVLRSAERHLGRWLLMAKIAHRAGDRRPLEQAKARAESGPHSSRAAWSLVAWALDPTSTEPNARPTFETVARLSYRPSADRDMTFLFQLGEAKASAADPVLDALARQREPSDDVSLRASYTLARYYDRADMRTAVEQAAESADRDDVKGVAAAALWELGDRDRAVACATRLKTSACLSGRTWGALTLAAAEGGVTAPLLTDCTFRRIQCGWFE